MPGTLYVCATPIGNLEDVSLRLLDTLRTVALICAEDTRYSRQLLSRHEISTPLTSCHQHTPPAKIAALVEQLSSGESLALVTDSGTPGVSDPGPRLVAAAAGAGIEVQPIPGPCAMVAALSISGFDAQRFSFLGFLPRKPGKRRKAIAEGLARGETLIIYESPYRAVSTLQTLADAEPLRAVVACRELTKKFEESLRGTAAEVAAELGKRKEVKGEFAIVVGPEMTATADDGDQDE